MFTNQVRELTADLGEIARKHENRDLTKAAIVELFATEACTIINPAHADPVLEPVLRHLQRAVEITAGMPQTVDEEAKPRREKSTRERFRSRLFDVIREFEDGLGQRRLAADLMSITSGVLVWDSEDKACLHANEMINQAKDYLADCANYTEEQGAAAPAEGKPTTEMR
jgi:hypothetical protein